MQQLIDGQVGKAKEITCPAGRSYFLSQTFVSLSAFHYSYGNTLKVLNEKQAFERKRVKPATTSLIKLAVCPIFSFSLSFKLSFLFFQTYAHQFTRPV